MIIDKSDFNELVERAMAVPGRTHMRPVIEKELLHYDILFVLDKEGLLDHLQSHRVNHAHLHSASFCMQLKHKYAVANHNYF